ncbi:hypothetical protein CI610_03229 [invertebrate metagenome]|uniref:CCHC-type domain-containing protein n=1 Tax=invertebrate metagenome TaxID=1711999 RepID=A0A2H9T3Q8_9ZZZZ
MARLKAACRNRGISFPSNIRRLALVRLLNNNDDVSNATEPTQPDNISTQCRSRTRHLPVELGARSHDSLRDVQDGGPHAMPDSIAEVLSSLASSVSVLANKVDNIERSIQGTNSQLSAGRSVSSPEVVNSLNSPEDTDFTLASAYTRFNSGVSGTRAIPAAAAGSVEQPATNVISATRTTFGYAAHTLPVVETVSPQLRTNIVRGRDINLAALLIPYFRGSGDNNTPESKPDHRLNRVLSLGEFIQAFGTFKQVMCGTFPHRRVELDLYERDIIDMASWFPGHGFYEYHCQFSMRAAALLRYNNVCVDWSVRDNNLFSNIFTNRQAHVCIHCGSSLHLSTFCPSSPPPHKNSSFAYNPPTKPFNKDQNGSVHTHGRPRLFQGNKEICNNFNGDRGCNASVCTKLHVCIACKSSDHSKNNCPLGRSGPQTRKK